MTATASAGPAARAAGRAAALVPVLLVLTSVTSVQFGAALAATLFPLVGPVAVVALRSVTSAAVLGAAARATRPQAAARREGAPSEGAPSEGAPRAPWAPVALGVVLAGMNTCVYAAVDRLPLGVVITLEFLGPLGVALAHSRRRADAGLALGAAAGVLLLTAPAGRNGPAAGGGAGLDPLGVLLALAGALGWALYILLTRELGRRRGSGGLALATAVGAALVLPFALVGAGPRLWSAHVLLLGAAVGVLSSAVPFSLDRLALRRLPAGPFGVLMSVNPAVATLAGLLVLRQSPSWPQLAGTAVVVTVSAVAAVPRGFRGPSGAPPQS